MPDFVNLMLVLTVVLLSINGMLMIAPNPITGGYGFGIDKSTISPFVSSEISDLSNVEGFTGTNTGQIDYNNLSGISSGQSQLALAQPSWNWFTNITHFIANLFLGFAFTLISVGVPSVIVFVIALPLGVIELFGFAYLFLTLLSIIAGVFRP